MKTKPLTLPPIESGTPLAMLLAARRSVRAYVPVAMGLDQLGMLLWAAQGTTTRDGRRTAPSAGALYPLELYAVTGEVVRGLAAGAYHYLPERHALQAVKDGDLRAPLADAARGQEWITAAAVVLVMTAIYRRTTGKYGERGVRYAHIEVGHAGQNICLMATALGFGTTTVGAFDDAAVARLLGLAKDEQPLYLLPVGTAAG